MFCKAKLYRVFDTTAVILVVSLVNLGSSLFIEKL
jgi:hypothetical protein